MKPGTRATTSTLSIATTRPTNSPVSVTSRLSTGTTVTAGGGVPCAIAPTLQAIRLKPAIIIAPQPAMLPRIRIKVPSLLNTPAEATLVCNDMHYDRADDFDVREP